jgi:catechol 2,3-dioxygenase-like lactoylglutathione lyase family enzyme
MRLLEIHLEVADLTRSELFYKSLLDYAKMTRWADGSAIAFILPSGTALGLWQTGKEGLHGGRGGRHVHFALQIDPGQYDIILGRLQALAIEVIEHTWPDGQRSIYFFDPDGHQGEFMTTDWLRGRFG